MWSTATYAPNSELWRQKPRQNFYKKPARTIDLNIRKQNSEMKSWMKANHEWKCWATTAKRQEEIWTGGRRVFERIKESKLRKSCKSNELNKPETQAISLKRITQIAITSLVNFMLKVQITKTKITCQRVIGDGCISDGISLMNNYSVSLSVSFTSSFKCSHWCS